MLIPESDDQIPPDVESMTGIYPAAIQDVSPDGAVAVPAEGMDLMKIALVAESVPQ